MKITKRYLFERLLLFRKCLFLLKARLVYLAKCLIERIVLISQWISERILLMKAHMLLFVSSLKKVRHSIFILACQASVFCVLFTVSRTSPSRSILPINTKNVALEASLDCTCNGARMPSKMSVDLKRVEVVNNKLLNIYNLTYGVSLDTTPQKYVTGDSHISNREMNVDRAHSKISTPLKRVTSQCLPLQYGQMELSLVDKVTMASRDVKNQALDLSAKKPPKAVEVLHIIFDHLNRFYYIGSKPIERDPSRVELKDPMGYYRPTLIRVGSIQKSVRLPGVPKTRIIKWGNTGLEIINFFIPKSSPIKPLINSLVKNTTIGSFKTTTLTRQGRGLASNIMYGKTLMAQEQHTLMLRQVYRIFHFVPPREAFWTIYHLRHPNLPLPNLPRRLNLFQLRLVAFIIKANFLPRFVLKSLIDIPRIIHTDGRWLVYRKQIKSVSEGILFECNLLGPVFVLLRQENIWTKYISEHFEISLRRTESNTMTTNMIEFQINASKIGFEALNTVISKTPVIKRISPVVNFVTLGVQEVFPIEVYLQAGKQHSSTINFNNVQESLRIGEQYGRNRRVANAMRHHLVTWFRPWRRTDRVTHLTPIHDRNFFGVTWMVRYDFDLFERLAKYTAPKHK